MDKKVSDWLCTNLDCRVDQFLSEEDHKTKPWLRSYWPCPGCKVHSVERVGEPMGKEKIDKIILKLVDQLRQNGWRAESLLVIEMFDALNSKREFDASNELLTERERKAMDLSAELWNTLGQIVSHGEGRPGDMREIIDHIHALQHTIMGQAGARAYGYRLLGDGPVKDPVIGRPVSGYGSKTHIPSRKDFSWDCNTANCRSHTFLAKQCVTEDCHSHSITGCPECNKRSRVLSTDQPETYEEIVATPFGDATVTMAKPFDFNEIAMSAIDEGPKRTIHMLYQSGPDEVSNPLCEATQGDWSATLDIKRVNCQECLNCYQRKLLNG